MSAKTMAAARVKMNNGEIIPVIGFGVYQIPPGKDTENAVLLALKCGYRHIDTAQFYRNEKDVGNAIRKSGIPREEIFVTSKMATVAASSSALDAKQHAIEEVNRSLKELGLDYVDLYLLHSPHNPTQRTGRWQGLEECVKQKKVRSIGVSNYNIHHLEELFKIATIKPQVNQIEVHPFCSRVEIREFCTENDILVEAYSPLAKATRMDDPTITKIAKANGITPAQVMLRWCLQQGLVILPKASSEARMIENMNSIEASCMLSDEDMVKLNNLDEDAVTGWDPTQLA